MDYQVVAENAFHRGRRLLVGSDGFGYIQLDRHHDPIPVPDGDFARLRGMAHYRTAVRRLNLASVHEDFPEPAD